MGLFNPGFLWFALGGAVPVIIHLLHRQKYRRVQWAAMEFLLAAIKKTQRRLQVENLILLLLRILIMLLLALAIMRPFLKTAPLKMMQESDTHHIMVIDNSYSMAFKRGAKSYFDMAKEAAGQTLKSIGARLSPQDKVTAILGSAYPEEQRLGVKAKEMQESLAALKLSHYPSNMYQTFLQIQDTLAKSRNQDKHVYVYTDFQRVGWEGADEVEAGRTRALLKALSAKANTRISLFDVAHRDREEPADNRSIIGLWVEESIVSVKRPAKLNVVLNNWSNVTYPQVEVKIIVDGSAQAPLTTPLRPNSPTTISTKIQFTEPGPHFVEAYIDSDSLDLDDHRYLAVDVKQGIQVLIVDGKPDAPPEDHSDGQWLKVMLSENLYNITGPITPENFIAEGLDRIDVLVLCNVQTLSQDKVEKIEEFVRRGGGLFLTLGDKVDRTSYNALLYRDGKGLLPGALTEIGGTGPEFTPRRELRIRNYDQRHPMWKWTQDGFQRAPFNLVFFQHFRMEKVDPDAVVMADLDDPQNSPLFLEKKFGDGKAVIFTSTINEEWSYRLTGSAPFAFSLWRLIPHLASRPTNSRNLAIGEPIQMTMASSEYSEQFVIETPSEGTSTVSTERLSPDSKWFQIFYPGKPSAAKPEENKPTANEGLRFAGKYSLVRPKGPGRGDDKTAITEDKLISYFASNVSPRTTAPEDVARCEGNLDRIPVAELRNRYPDFKFELITDSAGAAEAGEPPRSHLWKYLLYALIAFMCAETFLAWFFGRAKA